MNEISLSDEKIGTNTRSDKEANELRKKKLNTRDFFLGKCLDHFATESINIDYGPLSLL